MYDTEGNKEYTFILDNLLDCWQPHQHVHLIEKKQELVIKKWKKTSTYWKLQDKIFKLF